MFVDKEQFVSAWNVVYASGEMPKFVCIAVAPCFDVCGIFDEVPVF